MSTLRVDTILGESGAERRGLMTYAIIADQKAHNVDGGTFTQDAWQTRDLSNTPIADPDNIVSVANNQFTLQAGSYFIEATAPAFDVNRHQLRLYNATASTAVQYGQNAYCTDTYNVGNNAWLFARVTITGPTAFEIQHRCQKSKASNGYGVANNFGGVGIFALVKIFKEA